MKKIVIRAEEISPGLWRITIEEDGEADVSFQVEADSEALAIAEARVLLRLPAIVDETVAAAA